MSKGVLLFAHNNELVNYVEQAIFCAERIKKYMNMPVSLVTDSIVDNKIFDNIIVKPIDNKKNYRLFKDGDNVKGRDNWFNTDRFQAYNLSPYDQTIVLDTDFIVSNDNLNNLFNSNKDFACSKNHVGMHASTLVKKTDKIAINSIPMYWATVLYFTKSKLAETIFHLVEHIHDNWLWYKNLYGISSTKFRNDYAFSIAIHTMQNFTESVNDFEIPYIQYNSFDVDDVVNFYNDKISIISRSSHNDYHITYLKGVNVHIMNKSALEKIIKEQK